LKNILAAPKEARIAHVYIIFLVFVYISSSQKIFHMSHGSQFSLDQIILELKPQTLDLVLTS